MDAIAQSESKKADDLAKLKNNYLEALFRAESEAKRQGNLDGLQQVRQEIQKVDQAKDFSPSTTEGYPRLQQITGVMRQELDKLGQEQAESISALITSVTSYSEREVTNLTRQGKVNEAIKWQDWAKGLRTRQDVAPILAKGKVQQPAEAPQPDQPRAASGLFAKKPSEVITSKANGFEKTPRVYAANAQPDGKEKRIKENRTTMAGSGGTTFQARLKLVEEKKTLAKSEGWGWDYDHIAFTYVARLEVGLLPNQSTGPCLVVFDLFKRGSGSKRSIIRTEGVLMPAMSFGERRVIDSGTYSYETEEYDTNSTYDHKSSTADEFYGYIVSIFDDSGRLMYQRTTERILAEIARTEPPTKFDSP